MHNLIVNLLFNPLSLLPHNQYKHIVKMQFNNIPILGSYYTGLIGTINELYRAMIINHRTIYKG